MISGRREFDEAIALAIGAEVSADDLVIPTLSGALRSRLKELLGSRSRLTRSDTDADEEA